MLVTASIKHMRYGQGLKMTIKTEEQFICAVQAAEAFADRSPGMYKLKVGLFALLGYMVIFAILAILILLIGGSVAVFFVSSSLALLILKKKLIFPILLAVWVFLKALWVKFDKPEGYELKRDAFPELFSEIDRLSKQLKTLKIHKVILTNELNASVVQHPRFGLVGGQENYLFLGLQLLLALTSEQMRSVLAHEFGHLSSNHSRFAGWIYRVRFSWQRIMDSFEGADSFGARLMEKFFSWYAPAFTAYSFALARQNEYVADATAAELTSRETAARALVNIHAVAPYIDRLYWKAYFEQADHLPEPPHQPYAGLASFLRGNGLTPEDFADEVKEQLKVETHYADTHPALKDRLDALEANDIIPRPESKNAAQTLLGAMYDKVLNDFDQQWLGHNAERWRDRYQYVDHAKKTIEHCKQTSLESLDADALWDFAIYTDEFEGADAALPLFRQFQSQHPDSVGAAYHVGRTLSAKGDEEAIDHLRKTLVAPNLLADAARWGYHLLKNLGKEEAAEAYWQEALEHENVHKLTRAERDSCSLDDEYEQPDMSDELQARIAQALKDNKNAGACWLAQKVVRYDPEDPVYIVAFRPKGIYLSWESVMKRVAGSLDFGVTIFTVSIWGDTKKLGKKVRRAGIRIV